MRVRDRLDTTTLNVGHTQMGWITSNAYETTSTTRGVVTTRGLHPLSLSQTYITIWVYLQYIVVCTQFMLKQLSIVREIYWQNHVVNETLRLLKKEKKWCDESNYFNGKSSKDSYGRHKTSGHRNLAKTIFNSEVIIFKTNKII